jgi:fibronectin type 3 domain-containing protein
MSKSKFLIRMGVSIAVIGTAVLMLGCPSAKPAGQSATLASGHSVALTWQASPGAKYYYVYRSTVSKSGYQKIGTSPTPNYKDAPVPSRATFYYVVTAVDDKGESKYSSEIKAVVP